MKSSNRQWSTCPPGRRKHDGPTTMRQHTTAGHCSPRTYASRTHRTNSLAPLELWLPAAAPATLALLQINNCLFTNPPRRKNNRRTPSQLYQKVISPSHNIYSLHIPRLRQTEYYLMHRDRTRTWRYLQPQSGPRFSLLEKLPSELWFVVYFLPVLGICEGRSRRRIWYKRRVGLWRDEKKRLMLYQRRVRLGFGQKLTERVIFTMATL